MKRLKRLILYSACLASIALGLMLLMQRWHLMGWKEFSWGDAKRGYYVSIRGLLISNVNSLVGDPEPASSKPRFTSFSMQPGKEIDFAGMHFRQWTVLLNHFDYRRYTELKLSLYWPLALSVILTFLCLKQLIKQQRVNPHACPQCGYDLRATPDRCPECGKVTIVDAREGTQ